MQQKISVEESAGTTVAATVPYLYSVSTVSRQAKLYNLTLIT